MARRLWVRIPLALKDMTEILQKVKEIKLGSIPCLAQYLESSLIN